MKLSTANIVLISVLSSAVLLVVLALVFFLTKRRRRRRRCSHAWHSGAEKCAWELGARDGWGSTRPERSNSDRWSVEKPSYLGAGPAISRERQQQTFTPPILTAMDAPAAPRQTHARTRTPSISILSRTLSRMGSPPGPAPHAATSQSPTSGYRDSFRSSWELDMDSIGGDRTLPRGCPPLPEAPAYSPADSEGCQSSDGDVEHVDMESSMYHSNYASSQQSHARSQSHSYSSCLSRPYSVHSPTAPSGQPPAEWDELSPTLASHPFSRSRSCARESQSFPTPTSSSHVPVGSADLLPSSPNTPSTVSLVGHPLGNSADSTPVKPLRPPPRRKPTTNSTGSSA